MKIGEIKIDRYFDSNESTYMSITINLEKETFTTTGYNINYPKPPFMAIDFHTKYNKWYAEVIKGVKLIIKKLK